jgi:hypothetical protein
MLFFFLNGSTALFYNEHFKFQVIVISVSGQSFLAVAVTLQNHSALHILVSSKGLRVFGLESCD